MDTSSPPPLNSFDEPPVNATRLAREAVAAKAQVEMNAMSDAITKVVADALTSTVAEAVAKINATVEEAMAKIKAELKVKKVKKVKKIKMTKKTEKIEKVKKVKKMKKKVKKTIKKKKKISTPDFIDVPIDDLTPNDVPLYDSNEDPLSPIRLKRCANQPSESSPKRANIDEEDEDYEIVPVIRHQYGGGNVNQTGGATFPTDEEEEFFKNNTILSREPLQTKRSKKHYCTDFFKMKFTHDGKSLDKIMLHTFTAKTIDILMRKVLKAAGGDLVNTKYAMNIHHPENTGDDVFATFKTYEEVNGLNVMELISKTMQSNKKFSLDNQLEVWMTVFKPKTVPTKGSFSTNKRPGRGRKFTLKPSGAKNLKTIRDAIMTEYFGVNHDLVVGPSHCLPKALAIGALHSDRKAESDPVKIKELDDEIYYLTAVRVSPKQRIKRQLKAAQLLLYKNNMPIGQEQHNVDDLVKLVPYFKDYQIILWILEEDGQTAPIEVAHYNKEAKKFIGLCWYKNHYYSVTHTTGSNPARFCYYCYKFCDDNHAIRCPNRCRECGTYNCAREDVEIKCDDCKKTFYSQKCYDTHLERIGKSASYCSKYFYCEICGKRCQRPKEGGPPHICGATVFCRYCRKLETPNHQCEHHLPTEEEQKKFLKKQESWKVVLYDLECITTKSGTFDPNEKVGPRHKVNCIHVEMVCSKCYRRYDKYCTDCCEPWKYTYKDTEHPLTEFAEFLLESGRASGAHVMAHNGSGYDHQYTIAELIRVAKSKKLKYKPQFTLRGKRIIKCDFTCGTQKLYFGDTLQFIPMSLAKMPAAFGLTGEAKGNFPHLYNHPERYTEPTRPNLPPREYYGEDFMMPEEREKFRKWYEANKNKPFNLHDELNKYCASDVRILTLTLIEFIKICEDIFKWNPIVHSSTLASYVMFVMKNNYIKPGDIGRIPENGYGGGNNSKEAIKYIQWVEKKNPGKKYQYKLCGGEKQIDTASGGTYYADAYDPVSNEVLEIHGCLWHGCKNCHPLRDTINPVVSGMTMGTLYDKTLAREKDIRDAGYNVTAIWECEIKKQLKNDPEMRNFFKFNKYTHRLNPRHALFGGRTQVYQSLMEETPGFVNRYLDFTSMYPWINCTAYYPRGNPEVMVTDFPSTEGRIEKRGLIFCDVLPAPESDIGYLPLTVCDRLMFTLCRTCAEEQNISDQCTHHNISERYLTGVWTTDELNKAISRGYKVLKFHEIWYWPDEKWVKGGFFLNYIKPVLALKHQASGWPEENMDEAAKDEYIDRIYKTDGVLLDKSKVMYNPALRSLAKLFLNAAWGKFCQNPMKTETILCPIDDSPKLFDFFMSSAHTPKSVIPFGDEDYFLSRDPHPESVQSSNLTNLPIGIITTAQGRLHLIDAIEEAQVRNVFYSDTDSLIFRHKIGENPLEKLMGSHLGGLTDEIPVGKRLVGGVFEAPKAYALKMVDESDESKISYVVKSKGITMNSQNAQKITFDTMKTSMDEFIRTGTSKALEGEFISFSHGHHVLDGIWTRKVTRKMEPHMDKGHYKNGIAKPFGILPKGTQLVDDYPFYV